MYGRGQQMNIGYVFLGVPGGVCTCGCTKTDGWEVGAGGYRSFEADPKQRVEEDWVCVLMTFPPPGNQNPYKLLCCIPPTLNGKYNSGGSPSSFLLPCTLCLVLFVLLGPVLLIRASSPSVLSLELVMQQQCSFHELWRVEHSRQTHDSGCVSFFM